MSELPASRQLLNITKAALDHCEAECKRLRLKLGQAEKIAKLLPESAAEIERLRAALQRIADENWSPKLTEIAIRALKDKTP